MSSTHKDPVLVVLELTGANDYLNTIVPYSNPLYWDNRPKVHIAEDQLLPIDDELAFRSDTEPLKDIYDKGNMAIIHGIGFDNSPRSHFRAMDIWHTCEPDSIGINGWLAKVIRDLDPGGENVLKGVSLGQGLPRALTMKGFLLPPSTTSHPTVCSHQIRESRPSRSGPSYWRASPACTLPPSAPERPWIIWDRQDGMR